MASMCLLTKKKPLWLLAILMAAIATAMMISARLAEAPLKGPQVAQVSLAPKTTPPQAKQPGAN